VAAKTAAAVVTGSAAVAAAAAAAESGKQQQQQQQQRFIAVPAHHTAVLDMLLAPAPADDPVLDGRPKAKMLQHAMHATIEFLLLLSSDGSSSSSSGSSRRFGKTTQLPRIPVQMCLPLHMLLCEAADLAPELPSMHMALIFQMALLDIYVQVGS
jgi:hypothetical protein